jgi:HEAT repeat protein
MAQRPIPIGLMVVFLLSQVAVPDVFANERAVRHAVEVARSLYQSGDMYDRISGAGTLVDIGDKESLQFLTDYMNHDDWSVQRSAIDTLLSVEHPAGRDIIFRLAEIRNTGVFVKFLTESIASKPRDDMGEFLMGVLTFEDAWIRKFALQALAVMPIDDKETRITAFLADEAVGAVTRAYGYYALMHTPARATALAKLLEICTGDNDQAQEAAAVGLGLVDSDATKEALKLLRTTSTPNVRIAALASEAGLGVEEAIAELQDIIVNGVGLDSSVAAASLRRVRTDIAVQISETLMNSKLSSDAGTRLVESWAWIDADPAHIYAWSLNNENADIRMQAVWLVGQRKDREYLEVIIPMLDDTDSGIRGMAAWSIVRIIGDEYDAGVEI